ncbi:hypothetical protein ACIPY0_00160 [Paenarthrobacter nicotinovorans]|uniref:hypothetical protein n=1 Tax=Paenarthrobacter nicotinovorans TaxID=29320 RepID=UPI0037FB96C2
MTVLDDSVAILHGTNDNSLHWVWLSKRHGTDSIARVDSTGFYVRQPEAPGVAEIAEHLPKLWASHRAGVNLASHATHHLAPPTLQSIEPIPAKPSPDEFETEAMF